LSKWLGRVTLVGSFIFCLCLTNWMMILNDWHFSGQIETTNELTLPTNMGTGAGSHHVSNSLNLDKKPKITLIYVGVSWSSKRNSCCIFLPIVPVDGSIEPSEFVQNMATS
jgi:hypothetical protein